MLQTTYKNKANIQGHTSTSKTHISNTLRERPYTLSKTNEAILKSTLDKYFFINMNLTYDTMFIKQFKRHSTLKYIHLMV